MKPSEVIINAKALIATPDKWTQRAPARDANGIREDPLDDRAVCFCIMGALLKASQKVSGGYNRRSFYESISIFDKIPEIPISIPVFNNSPGRKHEEVLELFDKAIALAQKEED